MQTICLSWSPPSRFHQNCAFSLHQTIKGGPTQLGNPLETSNLGRTCYKYLLNLENMWDKSKLTLVWCIVFGKTWLFCMIMTLSNQTKLSGFIWMKLKLKSKLERHYWNKSYWVFCIFFFSFSFILSFFISTGRNVVLVWFFFHLEPKSIKYFICDFSLPAHIQMENCVAF